MPEKNVVEAGSPTQESRMVSSAIVGAKVLNEEVFAEVMTVAPLSPVPVPQQGLDALVRLSGSIWLWVSSFGFTLT